MCVCLSARPSVCGSLRVCVLGCKHACVCMAHVAFAAAHVRLPAMQTTLCVHWRRYAYSFGTQLGLPLFVFAVLFMQVARGIPHGMVSRHCAMHRNASNTDAVQHCPRCTHSAPPCTPIECPLCIPCVPLSTAEYPRVPLEQHPPLRSTASSSCTCSSRRTSRGRCGGCCGACPSRATK